MAGHGDGVKTGLALAIAVHLIEQGMRQALGDKVGDDQYIRLGKGGIIELGQRLLQTRHQIGTAVKTHGEKALRLVQTGIRGDLEGRHLGGEEHQVAAALLIHRHLEQRQKQRLGTLLGISPHRAGGIDADDKGAPLLQLLPTLLRGAQHDALTRQGAT